MNIFFYFKNGQKWLISKWNKRKWLRFISHSVSLCHINFIKTTFDVALLGLYKSSLINSNRLMKNESYDSMFVVVNFAYFKNVSYIRSNLCI